MESKTDTQKSKIAIASASAESCSIDSMTTHSKRIRIASLSRKSLRKQKYATETEDESELDEKFIKMERLNTSEEIDIEKASTSKAFKMKMSQNKPAADVDKRISFDGTVCDSEDVECFEILKSSQSRHCLRASGGGAANDSTTSIDIKASTESMGDEPEEEDFGIMPSEQERAIRKIIKYTKQFLLGLCWLTIVYLLAGNDEVKNEPTMLSVPAGQAGTAMQFKLHHSGDSLRISLTGPFTQSPFRFVSLLSYAPALKTDQPMLNVAVQKLSEADKVANTLLVWSIPVVNVQKLELAALVNVERIVEIVDTESDASYQLHFTTNFQQTLGLQVYYEPSRLSQQSGLTFGICLLTLIYLHLIFELVHRTVLAIISCTLGIALLAAVNLRPNLQTAFEWIEIDAIMIFFGISIIMDIMSETGLQDHLAALSYELANGHIWPLLTCLYYLTFVLSTLFDSITLVLFLAPVCLRLCQIMNLNCTPVLSALIIAINIGSTLSSSSSLSNYVIVNHSTLATEQTKFWLFLLHMIPPTLLALVQSYIHLRLQFSNSEQMRSQEPLQVVRLKHLIKIWRRVAESMPGYSLDEREARDTMDSRIRNLRKRLKRFARMPKPPADFQEKLQQLADNYPIRNYQLLVPSLVAIMIVLLFSVLSLLQLIPISKGWIAMLAALLCLSLSNYEDIDGMMSRIDWSTMLFIVCLFIIMQVLIKLGLMETVGAAVEGIIVNANPENRLSIAIFAIIWISAGMSAFLDNVPAADMMMRIIGTLASNTDINLPLMPLVWSLALGSSLGGNATIVAAVANIATAGVASRHGYRITFFGYLRIGFCIMLGNILIASLYLWLVHVQWHWDNGSLRAREL